MEVSEASYHRQLLSSPVLGACNKNCALDAANPSKVYAVEIAQYLRPGKTMPRPRGVLVYSVDAKLPTGFNPVVVHPASGRDKTNAALHEGESFEQDDAPLSLRVIKHHADDRYDIEITVK